MSINLSPALIALLPVVLHLIDRLLDTVGLLGGKYIRRLLKNDPPDPIRETFVDPYEGPARLDAIETYFNFEETAGGIIRFHLSFILSVYFEAVEKSHDLMRIEGWPVPALAVLVISLFSFLILLVQQNTSPAAARPFVKWSFWTWAVFGAIVVVEGLERLGGL